MFIECSCLNFIGDPFLLPQDFFISTYKVARILYIKLLQSNEGSEISVSLVDRVIVAVRCPKCRKIPDSPIGTGTASSPDIDR